MALTKATTKRVNPHSLSVSALFAFYLTLLLCSILVGITILNRNSVEKLEMEQIISDKCSKLAEVISKHLYKTEALSALVIQGNGEISNFENVADAIIDDPAILNVLIAPDGVVSDVYPYADNEAVIGLDFFTEGAGNKEAILARQKAQLVFGGPFDLIQGGQGLVGRLPVYTGDEKNFWGIVSVTLKFPEVLEPLELESLAKQGYSYEIWRINPDDGNRQVITQSVAEHDENVRYIEKEIPLLNAIWYFRMAPVRYWYEYYEVWILIIGSLFLSCIIAFLVQSNHELKRMKSEIENLAQLDPLIGIFNKRYFMEAAMTHVERSRRLNNDCFIIMMDIDFFKNINDLYGHLVGDDVLKELAARIKKTVRAYDLFARFGGEEFVILVSDSDETITKNLAERIRLAIREHPFDINGSPIKITSSFGVAKLRPNIELNEAIRLADDALYRAKAQGRDRVVYYEDN